MAVKCWSHAIESLDGHPCPLDQVCQVVFRRILNEKGSTEPVKVAGE